MNRSSFQCYCQAEFFFSCGITLYFHLQHTLYRGQHFYNYYVKNKHAAILQKFLLPCNFIQENIISWIFSLGRCKQQGTLFCILFHSDLLCLELSCVEDIRYKRILDSGSIRIYFVKLSSLCKESSQRTLKK